jgi:phosphonate transport system substrate-binding protein
MSSKRLFVIFILFLLSLILLSGCQRAAEQKKQVKVKERIKVLRVSAIPDEDPDELNRIYQPIVRYLQKQLGIEVKFVPVVDYAATVEGLVAKKLDLVWYGGLTHVQARKRTQGKAYAIVMRQEDAKFHSKFISRTDSGINTLSDLKGKTFAFGSVSSTSGHLMPRYFLLKHGLDPDKDFKKYSYSGAHDATAAWVQAGKVDAGALNEAVWRKLVETGKIDTKKVKVFWTTPAYVDYNWTVRGDLPKNLVEKIKQAFLRLDYNDPEDRKILDLHSTKGYIPASEDKWQEIEEAAKAAGLLE